MSEEIKLEMKELASKVANRHCDKISEQNPINFEDCYPESLMERITNTFYAYIITQVEAERERCARIAEDQTPSAKATAVLRCNPTSEKPYIDSNTMNGYDWACSDIAEAIRNKPTNKGE